MNGKDKMHELGIMIQENNPGRQLAPLVFKQTGSRFVVVHDVVPAVIPRNRRQNVKTDACLLKKTRELGCFDRRGNEPPVNPKR